MNHIHQADEYSSLYNTPAIFVGTIVTYSKMDSSKCKKYISSSL
jgi:hypothetical protein